MNIFFLIAAAGFRQSEAFDAEHANELIEQEARSLMQYASIHAGQLLALMDEACYF